MSLYAGILQGRVGFGLFPIFIEFSSTERDQRSPREFITQQLVSQFSVEVCVQWPITLKIGVGRRPTSQISPQSKLTPSSSSFILRARARDPLLVPLRDSEEPPPVFLRLLPRVKRRAATLSAKHRTGGAETLAEVPLSLSKGFVFGGARAINSALCHIADCRAG